MAFNFKFTKLTSFVVASAIAFTCVASAIIPEGFENNSEQIAMCKTAGPDVVGIIRYGDKDPVPFRFGECVLVEEGHSIAHDAYFCRPAQCYPFTDYDCKESSLEGLPIPIPLSVDVPNIGDFAQVIAQSVYCERSPLSNL